MNTVQNPISTQPRARKIKAALAAAAALAVAVSAGPALASDITLTDGNNAVTINPGGQPGAAGLNSWTINGVNELTQEWYYFAVGNSSGPSGLDTLNTGTTPVGITLSESRTGVTGVDNTARLVYTDPAGRFTETASYQLTGALDGATLGDITETLRIKNTSSSTLNLHMYEYTNLQLDGTTPNNSLAITGGDSATQSNPVNKVMATVTATPTNHSEAALASTLSTALASSSPLTLNGNATLTNADAALAYQWDLSLTPGQSVIINTDKNINSIPEPSSGVALTGAALVMMLGRRRSRRPVAS